MNQSYIIRRLPESVSALHLIGEFFPDRLPKPWADLPEAKINQFPWIRNYTPECAARVGWNELGLHVLMYACEEAIRCEETRVGGAVCCDSCLEFFLSPDVQRMKYINMEVNPLGVMHLGLGDSRHNRRVFTAIPDGFDITHSKHSGTWWAVSYTVPAAFILEHFGVTVAENMPMRGNFCCCGDKAQEHYGLFKGYDLPAPDYHRPELFADFLLL